MTETGDIPTFFMRIICVELQESHGRMIISQSSQIWRIGQDLLLHRQRLVGLSRPPLDPGFEEGINILGVFLPPNKCDLPFLTFKRTAKSWVMHRVTTSTVLTGTGMGKNDSGYMGLVTLWGS